MVTDEQLDEFLERLTGYVYYEELEIHRDEESYPIDFNGITDSIIWKDIPAADGAIKDYEYEYMAKDAINFLPKYLHKEMSKITEEDLKNIDVESFEMELADELYDEVLEYVLANYDDDDVSWYDKDDYYDWEGEYEDREYFSDDD